MSMNFFERRKQRKQLKAMLHHAQGMRNMREDVLSAGDLAALDAAMDAGGRAIRQGNGTELASAAQNLGERIDALTPACSLPAWRENFEVLVVALGVAMAFRAYFYQPFKIPTGSMQPTLYGISSVEQATPTLMDRMPFKVAQWLVTGSWYQEVRVSDSGQVIALEADDSKPGFVGFAVAGTVYHVPSDAVRERHAHVVRPDPMTGQYVGSRRVVVGRVLAGDVLWSGRVTAGDFVFVNRWLWNFRRPHRGEVMVFSTTGIRALPQGTHYIKRMCGLPNETLSVHPPELWINGAAVHAPHAIDRVVRKQSLASGVRPYAGYQTIGDMPSDNPRALRHTEDSIRLGPDEYFAMGDNTGNSLDSRYWGPVPQRNLLGPATVVYWPFASPRWGLIE